MLLAFPFWIRGASLSPLSLLFRPMLPLQHRHVLQLMLLSLSLLLLQLLLLLLLLFLLLLLLVLLSVMVVLGKCVRLGLRKRRS